jgi:hypothetical protein
MGGAFLDTVRALSALCSSFNSARYLGYSSACSDVAVHLTLVGCCPCATLQALL